jgi:hypothetical protein
MPNKDNQPAKLNIAKSAQALDRGAKQFRKSSPSAARSESVVRVFLEKI